MKSVGARTQWQIGDDMDGMGVLWRGVACFCAKIRWLYNDKGEVQRDVKRKGDKNGLK